MERETEGEREEEGKARGRKRGTGDTTETGDKNEIQAADTEQALLSASAEQRQYWGEDVKKKNVEIEKGHCCQVSNKLNNHIFHKAN